MGSTFLDRPLTLLTLLGAGCMVGCGGSDLVPVEGRVTLDGQPLERVRVVFYQPGEGPEKNFIAETDAEGRFALTTLRKERRGAAPGEYVVTLSTSFAGPDAIETDPLPPERVPPRFRELRFAVPPSGTKQADFELISR